MWIFGMDSNVSGLDAKEGSCEYDKNLRILQKLEISWP